MTTSRLRYSLFWIGLLTFVTAAIAGWMTLALAGWVIGVIGGVWLAYVAVRNNLKREK
jgi:hypothetical protein